MCRGTLTFPFLSVGWRPFWVHQRRGLAAAFWPSAHCAVLLGDEWVSALSDQIHQACWCRVVHWEGEIGALCAVLISLALPNRARAVELLSDSLNTVSQA